MFHRKVSKEHSDLSLAYPTHTRKINDAARAYSNPRQVKSPSSAQVRHRIKISKKFPVDISYVKALPTSLIQPDQERLREEGLSLKMENNSYREENLRLKTKLNQLEREIAKRDEVLDQLRSEAGERHYYVAVKQLHLVTSLKQTVKDLKTELKAKDEEILQMKKSAKQTQIAELEVEIETYITECTRLKKLIIDSQRPFSRGKTASTADQTLLITKLNKEKLALEKNLQTAQLEIAKLRGNERENREMPSDVVEKFREELDAKGKIVVKTEEKVKELTNLLKKTEEKLKNGLAERENFERKWEKSQTEVENLRAKLEEISFRNAQTGLQFITTKLSSKNVSFLEILGKLQGRPRMPELKSRVEEARVMVPENYWRDISEVYVDDRGCVEVERVMREVEGIKPRVRDTSMLFRDQDLAQGSGSELESTDRGREALQRIAPSQYRDDSSLDSSQDVRPSASAAFTQREPEDSDAELILQEIQRNQSKKPNLQVEVVEYEPSEQEIQSVSSENEAQRGEIKSDIGFAHITPVEISQNSHQNSGSERVSEDETFFFPKEQEKSPFFVEESMENVEELVSEKPFSSESSQNYSEKADLGGELEGKTLLLPANELDAVANNEKIITFSGIIAIERRFSSEESPKIPVFQEKDCEDEENQDVEQEGHSSKVDEDSQFEPEIGEKEQSEEEKSVKSEEKSLSEHYSDEEFPVSHQSEEEKDEFGPEGTETFQGKSHLMIAKETLVLEKVEKQVFEAEIDYQEDELDLKKEEKDEELPVKEEEKIEEKEIFEEKIEEKAAFEEKIEEKAAFEEKIEQKETFEEKIEEKVNLETEKVSISTENIVDLVGFFPSDDERAVFESENPSLQPITMEADAKEDSSSDKNSIKSEKTEKFGLEEEKKEDFFGSSQERSDKEREEIEVTAAVLSPEGGEVKTDRHIPVVEEQGVTPQESPKLVETELAGTPKSSSSEALEVKTKGYITAMARALTAQQLSVREVFDALEGKVASADFLHGLRTLGLGDLPPSDFQLLMLSLSDSDSMEIDLNELEELFRLQGVAPRPVPLRGSARSSLSLEKSLGSLTPGPASVQVMAAEEVLTSSAEDSQHSFYEYTGEAARCPDRLT